MPRKEVIKEVVNHEPKETMMNSRHLYAISIVAAGLILWSGGPATASDSGNEAPDGSVSSGSPNGLFNGIPDLNSPGGTKDAGTTSSSNSSGGDSTASSSKESGSGSASGQRQDAQVGDTQVDKGIKEGALQNSKAIKGELLSIKGDQYFLAGEDGKEVGLHVDGTTQITGEIRAGDRLEAEANEQSHALSIRSARK